MQDDSEIQEFLVTIKEWRQAGIAVAKHIQLCNVCVAAELAGGKGYCETCEKLWAEEMRVEEAIKQALPRMRELGIDVSECEEFLWQ